jgi:hypothetical protein
MVEQSQFGSRHIRLATELEWRRLTGYKSRTAEGWQTVPEGPPTVHADALGGQTMAVRTLRPRQLNVIAAEAMVNRGTWPPAPVGSALAEVA